MPKHEEITHATAERATRKPLHAGDPSALEIPYPQPLTKEQLAEHLQIGVRTIDNWIASRRIPFLKLGKLVRFRLADVERALTRFEVKEVSI